MTMILSGDGTITGLVAGGLPDATITADDLAAGAALNSVSDGVFFRNRIINGDMRIDQRNAGASVTVSNNTLTYTTDRWVVFEDGSMAFSAQQSSTAPLGFVNSLLITTTTSVSAASADRSQLEQRVEGFNVADLGWGTANAQTVTLSFWVRSSLTGQFGGAVQNSSRNRSYPFSFTINSANTFEYKTITITGDTSGTWQTTNGIGIALVFDLGMGSDLLGTAGAWAASDFRGATGDVKLSGTLDATWYITGVQLEVGSVATPFERRPYGTELALCQRYYFKITGTAGVRLGIGHNNLTTQAVPTTTFPVTMRAAPSALEQSGTAGDYDVNQGNAAITCSSVPIFSSASQYLATSGFNVSSGLTAGQGSGGRTTNTSGFLAWSAEL